MNIDKDRWFNIDQAGCCLRNQNYILVQQTWTKTTCKQIQCGKYGVRDKNKVEQDNN